MPVRNYTTAVSADRTIAEITAALVEAGATGVGMEYDRRDLGRIKSLRFTLAVDERDILFSLPADWRRFKALLESQEVLGRKRRGTGRRRPAGARKGEDEDSYCYRVAWRCLRDWVLAQLALVQTHMVEAPEVFLPYAMRHDGKTLYQIAGGEGGLKLLTGGGVK